MVSNRKKFGVTGMLLLVLFVNLFDLFSLKLHQGKARFSCWESQGFLGRVSIWCTISTSRSLNHLQRLVIKFQAAPGSAVACAEAGVLSPLGVGARVHQGPVVCVGLFQVCSQEHQPLLQSTAPSFHRLCFSLRPPCGSEGWSVGLRPTLQVPAYVSSEMHRNEKAWTLSPCPADDRPDWGHRAVLLGVSRCF